MPSYKVYICPFCDKNFEARGGFKYHLFKKKDACHDRSPTTGNATDADIQLAYESINIYSNTNNTTKSSSKIPKKKIIIVKEN